MDCLNSVEYKGHTIEVYPDTDSQNPRTDFDNFGKMVCFHSRYDLGDAHDFSDSGELMEHIKETAALHLPLYLYDHSGITINTSGFSCPWDSGQVGIIFVEREQILKEYSRKRMSKGLEQKAFDLMKAEVRTYDDYLTGNVYGYVIKDRDGEEIDSCWGFFGDPEDYMISECKNMIDHRIEREQAELKAEQSRRFADWENGVVPRVTGQLELLAV